MDKRAVFLVFISVLAGLNVGSIRRSEDPVRDTQTQPILYEQKKEEEKDGKKGPLMYNVKYNPRADFLTDPPIEKEKAAPSVKVDTAETFSPAGAASWWEEEPKVAPADLHSEAVPEIAPETEKVLNEEVSEQPVAEPKTEDAASTKKEGDAWW